jgi:hypothetical protein
MASGCWGCRGHVATAAERQELKPNVLTFWLGIGDKKASALCKGDSVWTRAEIEAVAEGIGLDLFEMGRRIVARLRGDQPG